MSTAPPECTWPSCLTPEQQHALAEEVLSQMAGNPPSPPPPDPAAACGCQPNSATEPG